MATPEEEEAAARALAQQQQLPAVDYSKVQDEYAPVAGARTFAVGGPSQTRPFFNETTKAGAATSPTRSGALDTSTISMGQAPTGYVPKLGSDELARRAAKQASAPATAPTTTAPTQVLSFNKDNMSYKGGGQLSAVDAANVAMKSKTIGAIRMPGPDGVVRTYENASAMGDAFGLTGGALPIAKNPYDPNNPRMLQMRSGLATEVNRDDVRRMSANQGSGGGGGTAVDRILSRLGGSLSSGNDGSANSSWNQNFNSQPWMYGSGVTGASNPSGVSRGRFYKGQVDLQQTQMNNAGAAARQAAGDQSAITRELAVEAMRLERAGDAAGAAQLNAMALERMRQTGEDARTDKTLAAGERRATEATEGRREVAKENREARAEATKETVAGRREAALWQALSDYRTALDKQEITPNAEYENQLRTQLGIPVPSVAAPGIPTQHVRWNK